MRERDLTRTRVRTAADHRGRGCSVMWSAEERHGYERPARRQQTCDRVDACHLERFLARERRKNPREAPREHGLPGAGRSCKQQVVRPRPRSRGPGVLVPDLERPPDRAPRRRRDRRRREVRRAARRSLPGSTRRPRQDDEREPARCPRARPPVRTPQRRPLDATRRHELLRLPQASRTPGEFARRAPARRPPRARPGARVEAAGSRPAARARWGDRSPIPPSGAPPERG